MSDRPIRVTFGDRVAEMPAGTTPEDARAILREVDSAVATATYEINDVTGDIIFSAVAGTKG